MRCSGTVLAGLWNGHNGNELGLRLNVALASGVPDRCSQLDVISPHLKVTQEEGIWLVTSVRVRWTGELAYAASRPRAPALRLVRHGRAAGELFDVGVADVAEIVDADFAGEEAVGGELAQEAEEFDALAQAGILLRILAVGDQVENFFLLVGRAIEIGACRSGRCRCCRATSVRRRERPDIPCFRW